MYRLNAAQPFIKGFQVTCAVGVPGCSLELELELEFYLFDRQLHNIGEIISKNMCEIILSGDSHKGTNWPLA